MILIHISLPTHPAHFTHHTVNMSDDEVELLDGMVGSNDGEGLMDGATTLGAARKFDVETGRIICDRAADDDTSNALTFNHSPISPEDNAKLKELDRNSKEMELDPETWMLSLAEKNANNTHDIKVPHMLGIDEAGRGPVLGQKNTNRNHFSFASIEWDSTSLLPFLILCSLLFIFCCFIVQAQWYMESVGVQWVNWMNWNKWKLQVRQHFNENYTYELELFPFCSTSDRVWCIEKTPSPFQYWHWIIVVIVTCYLFLVVLCVPLQIPRHWLLHNVKASFAVSKNVLGLGMKWMWLVQKD